MSLGITAYGFDPWVLPPRDQNLAHGNDERISVRNLEFGTHLYFDVLRDIAGR